MLKAFAEDRVCQCEEQLANESNDSPEPPKPPDDPAQQQTKSLSVELEGKRGAALSCDIEHTSAQGDGCIESAKMRQGRLEAADEAANHIRTCQRKLADERSKILT